MRYITIILIALLCAACSSALPSLKPYRMDIQQGNVVTSKMMLQLRPGMTKSQVRFIMGTPLIQDSFHADRWDYFYQMRKGGKIIEQRRVILEFENDALKQVRGDVIPAGTGDAVADPSPVTESPKSVKKKEKKGLLDRLKFWGDEPEQEKPQEAPAELISPAATPAEAAPAKPAEKAMPEETQPAQETPKQEQAPTEEAPAQPAEGMPEPGAPLGPDPEHLEKGTAPTVETPQAREIDESAQPVESQAEPEPAAEPAAAPEPAPAEPRPAVEEQPAKTEAPKAAPAREPAPAKQTKPAPQRKPAPQPEPDDEGLPPEDDPGYFERMLEKIGF